MSERCVVRAFSVSTNFSSSSKTDHRPFHYSTAYRRLPPLRQLTNGLLSLLLLSFFAIITAKGKLDLRKRRKRIRSPYFLGKLHNMRNFEIGRFSFLKEGSILQKFLYFYFAATLTRSFDLLSTWTFTGPFLLPVSLLIRYCTFHRFDKKANYQNSYDQCYAHSKDSIENFVDNKYNLFDVIYIVQYVKESTIIDQRVRARQR